VSNEETEKEAPQIILPRLIVGLGNPGKKYERTRHNIGFDVLNLLAREWNVEFTNNLKYQAHTTKGPNGCVLMKPQTFMNESGRSVGSWCRFFKLPAEEILIVYDDTSLDLGLLRFRQRGSAGGHNGVKSLISHLNTQEIPRLKIGVGSADPGSQVGHVLGTFHPDDANLVQNTLATSVQAVQLALSEGHMAAANVYNSRKKHEESPQTDEQEIRRTDRSEH